MRSRLPSSVEDPLIECKSFEEFELSETAPEGRFSIDFNGLPVDFLFENRGYKTTVVSFHGAVMTTIDLPYHPSAGVMKNVKANRLAVSDPSLLLGRGLKLGWFAGSKQQVGLQGFVEKVLRQVIKLCKTEHLVFFGASGGGFSSLEMSSRFPGSLALPMNPQTSITKYHPPAVALYVDVAWNGVSPFAEDQELTRHNLVDSYPAEPVNTIGYIQNSRDRVHIRDHQAPFFSKVGESAKVWQLMDSWGDLKKTGHVPPPKWIISSVLEKVASSNGDWEQGLRAAAFKQISI